MLLLGLVAIGVAIAIVVYVVGASPSTESEPAVALASAPQVGIPVPRSGDPDAELPPLYRRFADFARRLTPANYAKQLRHKLDIAGNPRSWTAERVLAFKGVGLVAGILLGALFGAKHGAWVLVFPPLLAAAGFFLPDVWIRNLGERRQAEIMLGLPDAIDMMTVCVEAGLGFDAALARVALNMEGAMAHECARVLQEMQFGMSRVDALRALVDRTDVPELRTFVSSMIQSSELGISVGDVLREQSREMRVKRRQRAEEKAHKLPVKILFPLLTCMLPAMFVVVLGPAAIDIVHTLSRVAK
jgi:pilus assembly protein TadC